MPIVDPIEPVSDGMAYTDLETVNVKPWPEPTVGEVMTTELGTIYGTYTSEGVAIVLCNALGLDASLPVSVLRARLAAGKRAEQCDMADKYDDVLTPDGPVLWATEVLAWIRGEDTP